MQSEEGKDLTKKEGKIILPLSMDEIQGPNSGGKPLKESHYAALMISEKYDSLGLAT